MSKMRQKNSRTSIISLVIFKPALTCPGKNPASMARSSSGRFREAQPKRVSLPSSSTWVLNIWDAGSLTIRKSMLIWVSSMVSVSWME